MEHVVTIVDWRMVAKKMSVESLLGLGNLYDCGKLIWTMLVQFSENFLFSVELYHWLLIEANCQSSNVHCRFTCFMTQSLSSRTPRPQQGPSEEFCHAIASDNDETF